MKICEEKDCTGCGLCESICPKGAISFKYSNVFSEYPVIDSELCVNCNLCRKKCPVHKKEKKKVYPIECFAGYRTDNGRLDAASGGIASRIAESFVRTGLVASVISDDRCIPKFEILKDSCCIEKIKGSKYVQAQPNFVYRKVLDIILRGERCLFIGMPCQVYAMNQAIASVSDELKKNLYTVDILCHGVSPTQFFVEELAFLEKKLGRIDRVSFRSNRTNAAFKFCAFRNNRLIFSKSYYEQPYYYGFINSITLRESCYSCDYSEIQRVGDLSLGDFIGLGKDNRYQKFEGNSKNASLILVNSSKGQELLELIGCETVELWSRDVQEAQDYCPALNGHEIKNQRAINFRKLIGNINYPAALRKIVWRPVLINKLLKYINYICRKANLPEIKFM